MKKTVHSECKAIRRSNERGAAIITALLAVVLITLLGFALTSLGSVALTVATNDRQTGEAYYIAEAGLTHAVSLIRPTQAATWTAILQASDDNDGGVTIGGVVGIAAAGVAFNGGTYAVMVTDDQDTVSPITDTNQRIIITSTGVGRDGSTAMVEAIIAQSDLAGVTMGGNTRFSGGSMEIRGTCGSAHANGTLNLNGTTKARDYFSAAAPADVTGAAGNGRTGTPPAYSDNPVDRRNDQNTASIPALTPANFAGQADYILKPNGTILRQSDGAIRTPAQVGWVPIQGGNIWETLATVLPGTYYAENGNIKVNGNPAEGAAARALTFIADGWVDMPSQANMTPDIPAGFAVIAGTDVKIGGNPNITGAIYCRDQMNISGNPTITGQLVAANLNDAAPPFGGTNLYERETGFMVFSGNPIITYNCGGALTQTSAASWRELRN